MLDRLVWFVNNSLRGCRNPFGSPVLRSSALERNGHIIPIGMMHLEVFAKNWKGAIVINPAIDRYVPYQLSTNA